ncbi:MAG TPA: phasin family protein [Alphaproteobacteria bacterium]|nr:phasin family protein [Alphaproteobacteria bacterium]
MLLAEAGLKLRKSKGFPMAQDNDTRKDTRKGESAQKAADQAAETARSASEQAAEEAKGAVQRQADTAADIAESNLTSFRRMTDESFDRFNQMLGLSGDHADELSQKASRNMDAIARSTSVLTEGYQSIYHEWMGFVQRSFKQNMNDVSTLMNCRTPQDLAAAHTDILKSRIEDLLNSTVRMSELSARTANDAVDRIGRQAKDEAGRAHRKA